MPIPDIDAKLARQVANEAERFARHMRNIPVDEDEPRHPEIKALLTGFKSINRHLSQRGAGNVVSFARKARVGREFQRIGASLRKRPARKR